MRRENFGRPWDEGKQPGKDMPFVLLMWLTGLNIYNVLPGPWNGNASVSDMTYC